MAGFGKPKLTDALRQSQAQVDAQNGKSKKNQAPASDSGGRVGSPQNTGPKSIRGKKP